jgi:magnesium-transporting ATPase (P-type)
MRILQLRVICGWEIYFIIFVWLVRQGAAEKTAAAICAGRCRAFSMTAKSIGRQTLLKYCIISVLAILTIFISTFLIFGDPTVTTVTLDNAVSTLMRDFLDNYVFVGIQTVLIIIEILIIGGLIGELIIKREKNQFLVGGLTLLTMWFLLFITCAVTGGIMNSVNYGLNGFKSAFMNWTVYGLLPFLFFGIIHGLTTGYFLGREIKKRGR